MPLATSYVGSELINIHTFISKINEIIQEDSNSDKN